MLLSDALCRMFAPLSRSALREELDPFAAATCSAEYPPRISPFTAAPSRTSSFTIAPCPLCDATCSAVHPCAFFASKFAPFHSPKTSAASSAFAARRLVQRRVPLFVLPVHVRPSLEQ